ncbi:MAG: DUF5706 domain-containing protein [Saprospiraceae bacterium]
MESSILHKKEVPILSDLNEEIDKVKKKGKKESAKALQTYFRNNYRTHISLSALADRKSHIMIRLNSLLISILIVFFKTIINLTPLAIVTGVVFLVTTLISLIFAALAAKPHVTKNLTADSSFSEAQNNIFFYGNYIGLDIDKYEEVVKSIMDQPGLIYGNMIRDLYYLGLVLDKKFRLLNYSYSVFIGGLIMTVISFLIAIHTM